jgi:hypothetical protein
VLAGAGRVVARVPPGDDGDLAAALGADSAAGGHGASVPRERPGHASRLRRLPCLGRSLLAAGLTMAPSGPVMMATAPVSAALSKARGPKITLMVGALIVAARYGLNSC